MWKRYEGGTAISQIGNNSEFVHPIEYSTELGTGAFI